MSDHTYLITTIDDHEYIASEAWRAGSIVVYQEEIDEAALDDCLAIYAISFRGDSNEWCRPFVHRITLIPFCVIESVERLSEYASDAIEDHEGNKYQVDGNVPLDWF